MHTLAFPAMLRRPGAARIFCGRILSRWVLAAFLLAATGSVGRGAQPFQPVQPDPLREPWRWRMFPQLTGLDAQCMAQGPDGTIWFGTSDGLSRYDGIEWTRELSDGGVLAGWVAAICFEPDGSVIAGGWWGISRFSHGKWTRQVPDVGVRFADIRKLAIAPDNSVWAATSWGPLRRQGSTWTLFTDAATAARLRADPHYQSLHVEILPEAVFARPRPGGTKASRLDLLDACPDPQGAVWFGTKGGELLCYNPAAAPAGLWSIYNEADGLRSGRVTSILSRKDGTLWVAQASTDRLSVFDGTAWRSEPIPAPGLAPDGGRLLETTDGVLWVSARYVLFECQNGEWRKYESPEVPLPRATNHLLQSRDGALWVAGPNTDVQRIDYQTHRWRTVRDLNFQCESPTGAQWFLHRDGRVVVHEAERWLSYGPEDGLIDTPVALLGARDGSVWAAGSHEHVAATARFDGRAWTRQVHPNFSWGIDARAVFESSDGSVWFGAAVDSSGPAQHRDGILQFRGGEWIHHHQPGRSPRPDGAEAPLTLLPAGHRPEPIEKYSSLGESRDGRIWAGRNVLVFHDGTKWTEFFPSPEFRRDTIIESMFTTRERDLWIGTRQYGALRYDGRTWRQFQDKDGLLANSVRSFAQTTDGSLWVASDRGVSRFDGQSWMTDVLPAALSIPHEGGELKSSPGGPLWVNRHTVEWTRRGWTKSPAPVPGDEFWTVCYRPAGDPPRTVITAAPTHISQPGNLSLLWSGSAAWRELQDARLEFSYRLDDQPWSPYSPAGGRAFFTLPDGPHRVSVRARDQDFNVDPHPAVVEFTVLPPVWRQAWFIALLAVLAAAILAQSFRVWLERGRLRQSHRRLQDAHGQLQQQTGLLHIREQEFRALAENSPDSICRFDAAGRIVYTNPAHCQALGRKSGELLGRTPVEIYPDEPGVAAYERNIRAALATGAASQHEVVFEMLRRPDPPVHDVRLVPERDRDGRITSVLSIGRDITALKETERKLRTLAEHSPDSIARLDADGRYVYVNPAFAEVFGIPAAEYLGGRIGDTLLTRGLSVLPPGLLALRKAARETAVTGTARELEVEFPLPAPRGRRTFNVRLVPERDPAGHTVSTLMISRDITESQQAREALRASEERFATVFRTSPSAICLVQAANNRFVDANEAFVKMTGYAREEILGRTPFELSLWTDPAERAAIFGQLRQPGAIATYKTHGRRKSGEVSYGLGTTTLVTLHGELHYLTLLHDITGLERAEEAQRLFRALIDRATDAIEVIDPATGRFLDVNERACQIHGYTREEFLELNVSAIETRLGVGTPAGWKRLVDDIRQAGGKILEGEHRRKDGTTFPIESSANYIRLGRDYLVSIVRDVTERRRSEEALRTSEERFRQVTENIDEVFWLTDVSKGTMIYISPAYERVWGRTSESLMADPRSWLEAVHHEDRARVHSAAHSAQVTGTYDLEYRIVRPDGIVRWIHDRAFPIRDARGRVYRIAGVAEDITARHQLQDQLWQAQKMESLGTLAGGIAHDFNNILTGVLGSAEVARLDLPPGHAVLPWINNIVAAGHRAKDLVLQILTFGRKHESELAPRRLEPVLYEVVRLLRSSIPPMVQIAEQISAECPPVVADDTQIHQVVMNLCTNAWHALPEEGGRIEVGLAPIEVTPAMAATRLGLKPGPHALITVRDNGKGMPPEVLARIFEPFFTTKKQGHGTGLGLAVVHGIIQSHQGGIFAHSAPGKGTLFEVFLPAMVQPPEPTVAVNDEPVQRNRTGNILLVDDDTAALAGLSAQLEHLGYRVTALTQARDALGRFFAKPDYYHLVITDYAMPDFPGQNLAARILSANPGFPIILTSGLIDPAILQEVRALGVRDFVRKPVALAELARVVARHIRSK